VTGKDGKEIKNPFKDVRVRRAISMAINRQAIVDRVMEGVAIPAGQLLPKGFFGVSPKIQVPTYNPQGAKKLLAEAGYPDGFKLTIHGPNDRYINDAQIVQAVAQMLSRIGIEAAVDTMPRSTFFGRASKLEFSLLLVGWGSGTGEASSPLKSLLATYNKETGMGPSNRGRYSNKEFDETLAKALVTVDDAAREKLLQKATEIAMADVGLIPLHYEVSTWATRKGLTYVRPFRPGHPRHLCEDGQLKPCTRRWGRGLRPFPRWLDGRRHNACTVFTQVTRAARELPKA
jgi:peptide/nickel transport system substrate-binding protein